MRPSAPQFMHERGRKGGWVVATSPVAATSPLATAGPGCSWRQACRGARAKRWQCECALARCPRARPAPGRFEPFLKVTMDECSAGFRAFDFLFGYHGLRGFANRDPCHRDWNDVTLAVKRAGLRGASWTLEF